MLRRLLPVLTAVSMILIALPALAEDPVDKDLVQKKEASIAEDDQADGWHFDLDLSGSFNITHNRAVVGQPSGVSLALGGGFGLAVLYLNGQHEWSASTGWKFGLSKPADYASMSKSQDDFFLQTRYLYSFKKPPWLGVFAKFRMESAFLPGWSVTLTDVDTLHLNEWDTNLHSGDFIAAGKRVTLTGPFAPLLLKEKAGLMATPVDKKAVKLVIDVGLGSHQMVLPGEDAFRLDDNDDTPELELRLMRPYTQIGAALEARLTGTPHEVIEYGVGAELMQPFYTSIDSSLKAMELLNVRLDALLRLKVYKYVMIDFTVDAKHYPLVIDKWQVVTNLLVTFHYEAFAQSLKNPPVEADDASAEKTD